MTEFGVGETTFVIPGPAGDLEVLTATPKPEQKVIPPIAIICHPHPLFAGTMNNKVVTTLFRVSQDLGLRTVRFNFRGVGKSAGTFDQGHGELEDLFAVVAWVKKTLPDAPIWLAGFSFGAYIAAKAAIQMPVERLVCVAPPVINFKMENFPSITCPWIVVQGDQDDVVLPEAVFQWAANMQPAPVVMKIIGAGHFFHGKLLELRERLVGLLREDPERSLSS